ASGPSRLPRRQQIQATRPEPVSLPNHALRSPLPFILLYGKTAAMKCFARTVAFMIASVAGGAMSHAAEIIVLASQGNPPGLNALAAAFARESGHKVTVLQETGKAL